MKCPRYDTTRVCNMEKSADDVSAVVAKVPHVKASPVKEPVPIKPQFPPAAVTRVVFSLNNDTRPVHNKENSSSREHDRALDEGLEDSGYLSLHNSQLDEHHRDEEDDHSQGRSRASLSERTISPESSPAKCKAGHRVSVVAASTPVDRPRRRILSSTPCESHSDPNLPILKFQRAVCEELAKNYRKNKRYDWSIVTKVAEDHLLDRVIGGKMGREYVDMFANLLSRNMRSILSNILALLGDMDLISCKRVSRTWRKIISEDTSTTNRCLHTEESLRESMNSLSQNDSGLTRDVGVSRVVLSCIQTRASSTVSSPPSSSSSSSTSSRVHRRIPPSHKGSTPHSQCTRFTEFTKAARSLKQHESLRCCKRCGSPATHSAEIQRATCTRLNCLFDFCTCCQETFHGSTPCRTVDSRSHFVTSRATPVLPGSARSKRNVRRL